MTPSIFLNLLAVGRPVHYGFFQAAGEGTMWSYLPVDELPDTFRGEKCNAQRHGAEHLDAIWMEILYRPVDGSDDIPFHCWTVCADCHHLMLETA